MLARTKIRRANTSKLASPATLAGLTSHEFSHGVFSNGSAHLSGAARAARSAQPPPTPVNENTARQPNPPPNIMGKVSRGNRGHRLALDGKVTAMSRYSLERVDLCQKPLSPLRGFRT